MPEPRLRLAHDAFTAPTMLEGEGFEVRRPVPSRRVPAIGPVILLDHIGPTVIAPGEAKGAPTHPHAGLETLTYLLEGRAHHLDSLGNSSAMGPGEVQWMRAGRGIVHDEGPDEQFRRTGGRVHGVQLWIDLPEPYRLGDPVYRHYAADQIPEVRVGAASCRLLAGAFAGVVGPVRTYADPLVIHVRLPAGASAALEIAAAELAAYGMVGSGEVGGCGMQAGVLLPIGSGSVLELHAHDALELLLVGGPPLAGPIVRTGPFVMSSAEQLRKVAQSYGRGEFGSIDVRRLAANPP